jgi:MazG family protein
MPGMHTPPDLSLPALDRLREIVKTLRSPGGCPWDIEQTQQSLIPNILEEAYEAADAIRSGNIEHMREELGDLLLQVVMQCEIASETGKFVIEDVAHDVTEKLVRRHPHVFADSQADDSAAVLKQWETIKSNEKGNRQGRLLDGLPGGMPSLMKAGKIQKKVEKVGFDWPSAGAVIPKIREEIDEVEEVLREGTPGPDDAALGEELGDVLFAVTNLARKLGMESESLLAAANEKFIRRFDELETLLEEEGTNAAAAGIEEMEKAWQRAKAQVG